MGWVVAASLKERTIDSESVLTDRSIGTEWVNLLEEGASEDR